MTRPPSPGQSRHFVTLADRQIHYRRAGSGPALVALHDAPWSSASLQAFIAEAAKTFTVIAPDCAGYGASSPIAADAPTLSEYVDDLAATLTALGIVYAVVYAEGIGVAIAAHLARKHPSLIGGLVVARVPRSISTSQADEAWPPFTPCWDGSHLAWAWAFARETHCFSPYYRRSLSHRILEPLPSPTELGDLVNQFVGTVGGGRHYAKALHACAREWTAEMVDTLPCRTTVVLVESLQESAPALRDAKLLHAPDLAAAHRAAIAALTRLAEERSPAPPPPPASVGIRGKLASRMVDIGGAQIHVQFNDDADTPPLFLQHDAASSVEVVRPITETLIGHRRVFAVDLPGSGLSDNLIGENVEVEVDIYADYLRAVIDALAIEEIDFYGMWGGGFVGLELALRFPARVRRLIMSNVFFHDGDERIRFQANYTPDVTPQWHGGHLMQAWHQMRDQGLFYPWFDSSLAGIIRREPFLATDMVHGRVIALLQAGNMYRTAYQSHFVYPTLERLASVRTPTLLATSEWDPNRPHTETAALHSPHCRLHWLDPDFSRWGLSFLPFLKDGARA